MRLSALALTLMLVPLAAAAQPVRGTYSFKNARECEASGKLTAAICRHAAANAEAEFDEKAPRFSSRQACESAFGRAGCSLSISNARGYQGSREGIYFLPRQDGFRVVVGGASDVTTTPAAGRNLGFKARTALRAQTERNPKVRIQMEQSRAAAARRQSAPLGELPEPGPDTNDQGFVPSGAAAAPLSPAEAERRRQRLEAAPMVR